MKRAKKKAKTTQTTTRKKRPSKIMSHEFFRDITTFRQKPISVAAIQKLSTALLEWAMEEQKALKIKPFFRSKGIGTDDVKRWRKKHPNFDLAYMTALEAIGDRREIGGLERKYDSGIVVKSMPQYDEEWKKIEKWRSALRKDEAKADNRGTVYIDVKSVEELKERAKK